MIAGAAWFFYAIGAAICWGLGYLLSEKTMDQGVTPISLMALYFVFGTPIFLAASFFEKTLKTGFEILISNKSALILFIAMSVAYTLGNFFIFKSISLKNATYTNLVEISYPLFTILFAWLLFKEFHLNMATIAGAVMIMSGVFLILLKS